ncbi:AI-2E family transporter [Thermodesulfobacteriota bacterium]
MPGVFAGTGRQRLDMIRKNIHEKERSMMRNNNGGTLKISTITAWVGLAVLVTLILRTLDFLFIPLAISVLLCYALGIPIDFLKQYRVPNYLRIILIVLSALVVMYLMGRLVHANVRQFQVQLPEFELQFWHYTGAVLERMQISPEQAREMMDAFFQNLKQTQMDSFRSIAQKLGGSFFSFLGNAIWVLLFMMFILAERENFSKRVVKGFGQEGAIPIQEALTRINRAVQHYLGLKTLVSLITGTLVALVLWVFGVHFALMWGVLAFLLNFIPNIGSLVATAPPVAIALFQFGSPGKASAVAVLIILIQMIVGNYLEPKIMGRGLNLSPLVVLLSLLFWGWMWGITGMLLSVPLTAAFKIGFEQLEATRPLAVMISSE